MRNFSGQRRSSSDAGHAAAALLVAVSAAGIVLGAALPVWRHAAQREKEAELVFRGEQYARAIRLYSRQARGALPPGIDILVHRRFLRKRYADPMVADGRFVPILSGQGVAGVTSRSPERSIKVYRGGTRYNAWRFMGQDVR
jgi:type II secretory pathway pseudopilin PulG